MARHKGQKWAVVMVGHRSSTAPLSGKHRRAVLRPCFLESIVVKYDHEFRKASSKKRSRYNLGKRRRILISFYATIRESVVVTSFSFYATIRESVVVTSFSFYATIRESVVVLVFMLQWEKVTSHGTEQAIEIKFSIQVILLALLSTRVC